MDALSELLKGVRLRRASFFYVDPTAPSCVAPPGASGLDPDRLSLDIVPRLADPMQITTPFGIAPAGAKRHIRRMIKGAVERLEAVAHDPNATEWTTPHAMAPAEKNREKARTATTAISSRGCPATEERNRESRGRKNIKMIQYKTGA